MSSPYKSNIAHLSTGYIHFADPTKPWTPNDFPTLPSTTLSLGAQGRIEDANIQALSFTNAISYEPYEPQAIKPSLSKPLQVSQTGVVSYSEPKVGFVSTVSAPFHGDVRSFQVSTIGGAHILDVTNPIPDTITNALGKLDSWIANAFLLQPPAIQPTESESTSLYSGVRWVNFNTYNILDKFVPYVTNIILTIGNVSTGNYCTLKITNPALFPYKTYRNGISPQQTPLVKLRIYSDFFVQTADSLYTKDSLLSNGFTILNEYGDAQIPSSGNVFAIDNTNRAYTYTTLSVYLPNLTNSYPKNTPIPVNIQYSNNTDGFINIAHTTLTQATVGGPSAPIYMSSVTSGLSTQTVELQNPTYADVNQSVQDPYFSSYSVKYTLKEMLAQNRVVNTGFRYGIPNIQSLPNSYSNVAYQQDIPYQSSIQQSVLRGTPDHPLIPGAVWSTSVYATNLGKVQGAEKAGPFLSTLFPANTLPNISSIAIQPSAVSYIQPANNGRIKTMNYSGGVWTTGTNVNTDVYYISTPTALDYRLSTAVQFNAHPGDQSTITANTFFTGVNEQRVNPMSLQLSTFNYDFPIGSNLSLANGSNQLNAIVSDTQAVSTFQKFFYQVDVSGTQYISSISSPTQSIELALTNRTAFGQVQTFSTSAYQFKTEPLFGCSTSNIIYKNTCTSTAQICGLYSPAIGGALQYDLGGANFANLYANPQFGTGALYMNSNSIGPLTGYSTHKIFSGATEITTLPLPQNTVLTISSCAAYIGSNVFQNPLAPSAIRIGASVIPANPINMPSTLYSTVQSMYIDTTSQSVLSLQQGTSNAYGLRIKSFLPQTTQFSTINNIGDGVDSNGNFQGGLNIPLTGLVSVNSNGVLSVNSNTTYNHTSTLSTIYTDTYTRELLFANGTFGHPNGLDFSQFSGQVLGLSNALYPDFTGDLSADSNGGYRYATFLYENAFGSPQAIQYLNIRFKNPSLVSTITTTRSSNAYFPDWPMNEYFTSSMMIRVHAKVLGSYNEGPNRQIETAWVNVLKERDDFTFDDTVYDIGTCAKVAMDGNDVIYTAQINRRYFTKICPVIRVGISRDAGLASAKPITFDGIQVTYSDTYTNNPC